MLRKTIESLAMICATSGVQITHPHVERIQCL